MKYQLTEETKNGLFRIKALKDFGNVKAGDLGGWIEKESCLSQHGNAWVYGNAWVSGSACVYGNAQVYDNARVSGSAQVYGNAWVSGSACVYGSAQVYGNAWVYGSARVHSSARVHGDACVYGSARIYGDACVYGDAQVYGNAWVSGDTCVYGDAQVYGNAWVSGDTQLKTYDEVEKPSNIITITGFTYPITVTPMSINIGCRNYTFDQLDSITTSPHEHISETEFHRIKLTVEIALDNILENV